MAQPPIDKLRSGNLTATIWLNFDTQSNPFFSCALERSYTDKDGNWHQTTKFGRTDLLRVAKLADQAHSRIEELIEQAKKAKLKTQSEAVSHHIVENSRSRQR
ncbi:MAG: hypothetical protein AAGA25_08870 [Planctomycetota bacterium]